MNIITIDCGASFIKGCLFRDGEKQKESYEPAPHYSMNPIGTIGHINGLAHQFREMLLRLSEVSEENILCVSNEMHGFILTDEYGKPITDYISWQNDLGKGYMANIKNIEDAVIRTGMPVRGGLPSSNLYWLIQNNMIRGKKSYILTLGDYLIRSVSGKMPYMHLSNAAATGMYDLQNNRWSGEIIDYIEASSVIFPEVSDSSIHFVFEGRSISVYPAIGDQQAALLGAGLDDYETLSFNLGTGAQVSKLSDKIIFGSEWQVRPYFNNRYILCVPHIPSGRAINVYFRFVKSILERYGCKIDAERIWDGIREASESGKDTALQLDLGFFENAVNDSKNGAINNIYEYTFSMDNLFYGIIKQIADNSVMVSKRIGKTTDYVKHLLFSGGISRRFPEIKTRIAAEYSNADLVDAKGDTLEGLYLYAKMHIEAGSMGKLK